MLAEVPPCVAVARVVGVDVAAFGARVIAGGAVVDFSAAYRADQFHSDGEGLTTVVFNVVIDTDFVAVFIIRRVFEDISVWGISQCPSGFHFDAHVVRAGAVFLRRGGGWRYRRRDTGAAGGVGGNADQGQDDDGGDEGQYRQRSAGRKRMHRCTWARV